MTLCEKLWSEPKKYSEAWNFGPEKTSIKSVKEISQSLKKYGVSAKISIVEKNPFFKESRLLHLNSDKANNRLGGNKKSLLIGL